MKKIVIMLAVSALMASCINITVNADHDNSEEYGPAEERVYSIGGNYHELEVSHAFEVTMSDTATVATITIDSALHDRVVFRVNDGVLKIALKPGSYHNISTAKVVLPRNEALDEIELNSASRFTAESPLAANKISIELSGASNFRGDIVKAKDVDLEVNGASHFSGSIQMVEGSSMAGSLSVDLSGAATATISGSTGVLNIDISGASSLNAKKLDARTVEGDVSGASDARVLCCESIEVDVSGSSTLTYSTVADGCEPTVKCSTSGASTVTRQ